MLYNQTLRLLVNLILNALTHYTTFIWWTLHQQCTLALCNSYPLHCSKTMLPPFLAVSRLHKGIHLPLYHTLVYENLLSPPKHTTYSTNRTKVNPQNAHTYTPHIAHFSTYTDFRLATLWLSKRPSPRGISPLSARNPSPPSKHASPKTGNSLRCTRGSWIDSFLLFTPTRCSFSTQRKGILSVCYHCNARYRLWLIQAGTYSSYAKPPTRERSSSCRFTLLW